jgi:hypothetical protein
MAADLLIMRCGQGNNRGSKLNSDVRVEDAIPDGQANVSGLASIIAFEGTIGAALADTSQ